MVIILQILELKLHHDRIVKIKSPNIHSDRHPTKCYFRASVLLDMIAFVLRWEWETIVQQIGYPSPVQPPVRMEVSYSFQEKIQVLLLPIKSSHSIRICRKVFSSVTWQLKWLFLSKHILLYFYLYIKILFFKEHVWIEYVERYFVQWLTIHTWTPLALCIHILDLLLSGIILPYIIEELLFILSLNFNSNM